MLLTKIIVSRLERMRERQTDGKITHRILLFAADRKPGRARHAPAQQSGRYGVAGARSSKPALPLSGQ